MKKIDIMGILNITPDSFSDGGEYFGDVVKAVSRTKEMIEEGADSIDVGGESTRPGSEQISVDEELRRVIPVISAIRKKFDSILISIDTYKAKVAKEAIKSGATMVNSLGGFLFDQDLADVVKESNSKIVIYHIKGKPRTMQTDEIVYKDVIEDIKTFFEEQISFGVSRGIPRENFILDPGIGFGKTLKHNLEIIKRLSEFTSFNLPILIGISRKSHLGNLLQEKLKLEYIPSPLERLEASLAETAIAVTNGATIIRTHDIKQTKEFLTVLEEIL